MSHFRKAGRGPPQGAVCGFLRDLPKRSWFSSYSYHPRDTPSLTSPARGDVPVGTAMWCPEWLCMWLSPPLQYMQFSITYFFPYPGMKGISVSDLLSEEDRKWNEICRQDATHFSILKTMAEQRKYPEKLHMSSVLKSSLLLGNN